MLGIKLIIYFIFKTYYETDYMKHYIVWFDIIVYYLERSILKFYILKSAIMHALARVELHK